MGALSPPKLWISLSVNLSTITRSLDANRIRQGLIQEVQNLLSCTRVMNCGLVFEAGGSFAIESDSSIQFPPYAYDEEARLGVLRAHRRVYLVANELAVIAAGKSL